MTCRWRVLPVLIAVALTAHAFPATAQPKPKNPSLAIEPISARGLLAPAERDWKLSLTESERERLSASYRLGSENLAAGQRAKLSMELGDTTVFAIAGRLGPEQPAPPGPLDASQARAIGQRSSDGSRIYGAGAQRRIGPVEVGASYQYSKIHADRSDSNLRIDNPKSHSVRATARIRFRN